MNNKLESVIAMCEHEGGKVNDVVKQALKQYSEGTIDEKMLDEIVLKECSSQK